MSRLIIPLTLAKTEQVLYSKSLNNTTFGFKKMSCCAKPSCSKLLNKITLFNSLLNAVQ